VYIGSASHLGKRWARHRVDLNSGIHRNPDLQALWSEHGADQFVFEVLEIVPSRDDLTRAEQEHLDRVRSADPNLLFNKVHKARRNALSAESKAQQWTHIRVPIDLAGRLDRLVAEMGRAYSEGRLSVPNAMCERIPAWYVIQSALDEVEARRARSARPRAGRRQP
jgi:hypothetical protein